MAVLASASKSPSAAAVCPKCGRPAELVTSWVLKSPKSKKGIVIGLFRCPEGHKFRKKIGEVEE